MIKAKANFEIIIKTGFDNNSDSIHKNNQSRKDD